MNNVFIATLTSTLLFSTALMAQEDNISKDSFVYLGGNIALSTPNLFHDQQTRYTAGIEAVYLKKVWGNFSLGISASAGMGLHTKINGHVAEQAAHNGVIPAYDWKSSQSNKELSLSLLMGFINNNEDGSQTSFVFGPSMGGNFSHLITKRDFLGEPVPTNYGIDAEDKDKNSDAYLGLTVGAYHKIANSRWAFGLVGTYGYSGAYSGSHDGYTTVRATFGYSF